MQVYSLRDVQKVNSYSESIFSITKIPWRKSMLSEAVT